MRPINSQTLVNYGESFARIGSAKRAVPYTKLKTLEDLIIQNTSLPSSADISPTQPPYFTEFTYTDLLGGMLVRSFSAEINLRIARNAKDEDIDPARVEKFLASLTDKYALRSVNGYNYKRVVFLCGHNIFDRVVDSQKLYEIMDTDKSVVIKPHPISNDGLLRNLGNNFGYNRILDKDISGYDVMANCEDVICPTTSELAIVAILRGKKFTDITQYMQSWLGISSSIIRESNGSKEKLLQLLLGSHSGFLLPDMETEEVIQRINNYCTDALKEREPFEMLTSQRLAVNMPRVMEGPKPPEKEQK